MHVHHHHHRDQAAKNQRRLAIALVLAGGYMMAEVVGGWLTNSLALLADASHMFSDMAALGLGYFAVWFAGRTAPAHRTFGYHRVEILAALANGALLIAVAILISVEAFQRLGDPPKVEGPLMMTIAIGGLLVNLISLMILKGGRQESLNVRGAWLHVVMDALGSVGAIVAGVLISWFNWYLADPMASILLVMLVVYSAWHLLSEAVSVLMESAPRGIDVDQVRAAIVDLADVIGVHDLHVWTITSGFDALSAHVVISDGASHTDVLSRLRGRLHERFGIDHITIQIEPEDFEEGPTCT